MSELQAYLGDHAIPELFNRLYGDAERLSGDIERLKRFVELTMGESSSAPAPAPVSQPSAPEPVELEAGARQRLEEDADQAPKRMVARFELMINKAAIVPDPAPAPAPVEMDAGARQRLEEEAKAAAKGMVLSFELLTRQGQSTATCLAGALRVSRMVSSGFECPHMMAAILQALDGMDAAAREEQSNG